MEEATDNFKYKIQMNHVKKEMQKKKAKVLDNKALVAVFI